LKLVTRDSGGSYTVSSTQRPFSMGLVLSGFSDDKSPHAQFALGMH
jgi:hypothetical protein